MNIFLANLINFIHTIFVLLMQYGFILPKSFLKYYLLLWPITLLHWKLNNNNCILTQIELKLRGIKEDKDYNYPFMKKLYFNIFNLDLTTKQIHNFLGLKNNILWLIGAAIYLRYKKMS